MDLQGLCLKTVNYKEKDKLLILATFNKGIITVNAKGIRTPKSKLKAGAMPLTFADFSLIEGKSGYILKGVDIKENFFNCWNEPKNNVTAFLITEIIEKISMKEQDISYEIILALKALKEINYENVYPFAVADWFILKIFDYIGIDYTSEELPTKAKEVLDALYGIEIEDIQTIDICTKNIDEALYYLNLIIKNKMSVNIKIFKEIVNMFIKENKFF